MTFLHDAERQLDDAEARAELLCGRLSYVGELEHRVLREPHSDPDRALRLAFLRKERERLILEIRMMFEAICKLEVLRDQALKGEID